jgi:hypothetical protein
MKNGEGGERDFFQYYADSLLPTELVGELQEIL